MTERSAARRYGAIVGMIAVECAVGSVRAGVGFVATVVFIRAALSTICVATMTSGVHIASHHLAFHAGDTKVIQGASKAFGPGSEEVSV